MYTNNSYKQDTTEPKNDISQKEKLFHIDDYEVGTYIIEQREGRENQYGVEKKNEQSTILDI